MVVQTRNYKTALALVKRNRKNKRTMIKVQLYTNPTETNTAERTRDSAGDQQAEAIWVDAQPGSERKTTDGESKEKETKEDHQS